jgi:hypothetical protein
VKIDATGFKKLNLVNADEVCSDLHDSTGNHSIAGFSIAKGPAMQKDNAVHPPCQAVEK